MMDNDKEYYVKERVEKFVKEFIVDLEQIKQFVGFIDVSDESREELNRALKILSKTEKKIINLKTIKYVKKNVKLKKLLNDIQ